MDQNGLWNPFTRKYFPAGFVEHIAGRRRLVQSVSGVKCNEEDKQYNDDCSDIEEVTEPNSLDRLTISWRQSPWNCKVVLEHRYDDGLWTIVHVESERRGWQSHSTGMGINYDDNKPWPWFYVRETADQEKMWWKCPWRIVDALETHIKKIRRMREGALVREVERAPPAAYYEQEPGAFVREVEDQKIPCELKAEP